MCIYIYVICVIYNNIITFLLDIILYNIKYYTYKISLWGWDPSFSIFRVSWVKTMYN